MCFADKKTLPPSAAMLRSTIPHALDAPSLRDPGLPLYDELVRVPPAL